MEPLVREALLSSVTDYTQTIEAIHLFHHWVVVKAGRYEMSTRFKAIGPYYEHSRDTWLGDLIGISAAEVAHEYLAKRDVLKIAVGMACLKCVIPAVAVCQSGSAMDYFADATWNRATCFIGRFQQAVTWREQGRPVTIVELEPKMGDVHWDDASTILAKADIVFMTGLTLVNGTFSDVIARTPRAAIRVIMGPTVPVTPALFERGVHWIGGTRMVNTDVTLRYFSMGGGSIMYAPKGALEKYGITI